MSFKAFEEIRLSQTSIEIIDGDRGKNYPKQNDFLEKGFCLFLNTKNVTKTGFEFTECSFVSEKKDKTLRKGKLARKDIVLTTRGTVGNVGFYDNTIGFNNIRINSGMVILRPNVNEFVPEYLYLLFKSRYIKSQIESLRTGSAQPQLPISIMKNLKVIRPPLQEQNAIACLLFSLDNKIELNNRINKTLEEMAQAIFKSWFVDFEPFRDGVFEESELGEIPKGWKVYRFTDIADVLSGGTPKTSEKTYWNGEIPFFTPKDAMDSFYVIETEKSITDLGLAKCNSKLYPQNTVFITARGTVGKVVLNGSDMAMNQSCYALQGKNGLTQTLLFLITRHTVNQLKKSASGAVFDAIIVETFRSIRVLLPPVDIIKRFTEIIEPIFKVIKLNTYSNETLMNTRDTILPKLMSGEIRVPIDTSGKEAD